MKKTIIAGIALFLAGLGAGAYAVWEIAKCLPHEGPYAWSLGGYRAPYPNHGFIMVALIAFAIAAMLIGTVMVLVTIRANER